MNIVANFHMQKKPILLYTFCTDMIKGNITFIHSILTYYTLFLIIVEV